MNLESFSSIKKPPTKFYIRNKDYFKKMKVNLEKITFYDVEKSLKREIKKDISEFDLDLYEDKMEVHIYLKSKEMIILNCGKILDFEFPKNSQEQKMINKNVSIQKYRGIGIMFLYNNKKYFIQGKI